MLKPMLFKLILASWQTLYMVFIAAVIAIVGGLMLSLLLYFTRNKTALLVKGFHHSLGFIVNITRSIPYIILLILLYPITSILIGTTIGTSASVVPLAAAALPFYARLAESAILEVDTGLIEAADAMGATKRQLIFKVLLPEAKTLLIDAATLTVISLIGYSAMAGIVGGGGLGDLTYFQGYNEGNYFLLYGGVILLIILVQLCQSYGHLLASGKKLTSLWFLAGLLTAGVIGQVAYNIYNTADQQNHITVAYTESPAQDKIMHEVALVAKDKYHLDVQLMTFGDYNLPNRALSAGDIDANVFQHIPFLESQIKQYGYPISAIGKTFIYPMGLFSAKIDALDQLQTGDTVAIPNDPTNEGRALMLLADAGLIQLKPGISWRADLSDIVKNPYKLKIIPLQADQIPNNLGSVALAAITNDFLAKAHLRLKQALFIEPKDSPFANIIVVRNKDKNNPLLLKFVKAYQSPQVVKVADKVYPDGAAIPAW